MKKNVSKIMAILTTLTLSAGIPALAIDEVAPVKVEAKKSVGVLDPKPGIHTCSVTNMPANSACAGTINQNTWETMIQYGYMDMSTKYNGSTVIANTTNTKMSMSMAMAMLSYGVTDYFSLSAMIPTVSATMSDNAMGTMTQSGLGDISVNGKWRVWSDGDITTPPKSFDDLRDTGNSVALMLSVKAPTGENNAKSTMMGMTTRIADTMQLGTGSWDERFGVSYSKNMNPFWVHASAFYNLNNINSYGYQFGNKTSYNVAFQFEPMMNTVLGVELNGDTRNVDTKNGVLQANTGGSKLLLSPSVQYQIGDNWDIQAGYNIPVAVSVNGTGLGFTSGWFVGIRGTL